MGKSISNHSKRASLRFRLFALGSMFAPAISFIPVAHASTTIFSDGFGVSLVDDTTFDESPAWSEGGNSADDATKKASNIIPIGNDSASPNGSRFALLEGNNSSGLDGWICRTMNATGYNNLTLSYYWRGDTDANNPSDDGIVEYKTSGNCSDTSGWTNLKNHDLQVSNSWTTQSAFALPAALNNTSFLLRFRADTNSGNDDFRVDGIEINADAVPTTGTLHVIKNTAGGDGTFNFTGAASFQIITSGNTGSHDITGLTAGNYSVDETADAAWTTVNGCQNVSVTAGNTTNCTITNTKKASITVTKVVTNDNGGTKMVSDFPLFVNGGSVTSGAANLYVPGEYTVSETGAAGYMASFSGDCDEDGVINAVAGGVYSCTITNNDVGATVHVIKHVINDDGGNLEADDFSLNVTQGETVQSFQGSEAGTVIYVNAGEFTVGENEDVNYELGTTGTCSGTAVLGGEYTCTLTNDDVPPTLTVNKVVVNDGEGEKNASNFTLKVDGGTVVNGAENEFAVGAHVVSEVADQDYAGTFSGDCDAEGNVTLAFGDHKSCTITNNDIEVLVCHFPPGNPGNFHTVEVLPSEVAGHLNNHNGDYLGECGSSSSSSSEESSSEESSESSSSSEVGACLEDESLVAYWKLNESEGTAATDSTSYNNVGTHQNGVTVGVSAAPTGFANPAAASFDGTDDFTLVTDTTGLPDAGEARTIALWVNMDAVGYQSTLLSMGNGATADQRFIFMVGNEPIAGPTYVFTDGLNGANNITISGEQVPATGGWHHVAFTLNGSDGWAYYLDGSLMLSGTFVVPINTVVNQLEIGSRHDSATGYFDGALDDVRIYNRALAIEEIAELTSETCGAASSSSSSESSESSSESSESSESSSSSAPTVPMCDGLTATIYVQGGFYVGGPENGQAYDGTIKGTSGNDVIVGTSLPEAIDGKNGDDVICGGAGGDLIDGGTGNDEIFGQDGNDIIKGGNGNDTIRGGAGNDILEGAVGNDLVRGGDGNDAIDGFVGNDILCGRGGNDAVNGGIGNDKLDGNDGNDALIGGLGSDICRNGEANVLCDNTVTEVPQCGDQGDDNDNSSSSSSSSSSSEESSSSESSESSSSSSEESSSSSSSSAPLAACVPSDLIAYYNMDEGEGALAADVTGNGHDATLVNGPAWGVGTPSLSPNGAALFFDGNDDIGTHTSADFNLGTGNFTISTFLKSNTGNRSVLGHYDNVGGFRGWGLYVYEGGNVNFFGYGDLGVNDAAKPATVLDNAWHHVVGVYERSGNSLTISTYVDGVFVGSNTAMVGDLTISTPFTLGKYTFQPNFLGNLDDVRIYGRALTLGEIQDLADGCASASSEGGSSSSEGSESSEGSSSSDEGGSSSSSSNGGGSEEVVNTFGGDAVSGDTENGAYRGKNTNRIGGAASFLAGVIFGSGNNGRGLPNGAFGGFAPGAFGGSEDVPLSDGEKKYLCTIKKSMPAVLDEEMIDWMSKLAAKLMGRPASLIAEALENASLCDSFSATAKTKVSATQLLPFPVDAKGVPVSSNPTWNKCIRGSVTIEDIRNNPDVGMSCGEYHTQESWYHPDLRTYFTYNRVTGKLVIPAGYVLTKTTVKVTMK